MSSPADVALRKIEKVLSRDPVLRDVLARSLPRQTRGDVFSPDVDVIEQPDRFVILLDVPGVPRDTLQVELDGAKLTVAGRKSLGHPEGRVRVGERSDGAFQREFLLPSAVDPERVTAKLADGVLTIEVPRAGTHRPVHVDVK